jgi:hypothetical protein
MSERMLSFYLFIFIGAERTVYRAMKSRYEEHLNIAADQRIVTPALCYALRRRNSVVIRRLTLTKTSLRVLT